eukprot:9496348-Pyramimonas_sp.AAC.1
MDGGRKQDTTTNNNMSATAAAPTTTVVNYHGLYKSFALGVSWNLAGAIVDPSWGHIRGLLPIWHRFRTASRALGAMVDATLSYRGLLWAASDVIL